LRPPTGVGAPPTGVGAPPGGHFEYYDSCSGANAEAAEGIRRCFGQLLGCDAGSALRVVPTPQQTNGYDCGAYLLRIAQVLCAEACESTEGEPPRAPAQPPAALLSLTPASVGKVRAQLLGLVEAYATPAGEGS